jgi:hypothetical protein
VANAYPGPVGAGSGGVVPMCTTLHV